MSKSTSKPIPNLFFQSEEAAIAIHVQQPVAGVSITCPAALATFEEINCHCIVIAGSDLEVSVSFEDEAAEVFPIAGMNNIYIQKFAWDAMVSLDLAIFSIKISLNYNRQDCIVLHIYR